MPTTMSTTHALAWHFVGDTLRDGKPIPQDGIWLHHLSTCVMCESGLHASRRILDALVYAPGATICRVECADIVGEEKNKLVAKSRKILWRINGEEVLRAFAEQLSLSSLSPRVPRHPVGRFVIKDSTLVWYKAGPSSWSAANCAVRNKCWGVCWNERTSNKMWDAARNVEDESNATLTQMVLKASGQP